jgi:hypothetical protein
MVSEGKLVHLVWSASETLVLAGTDTTETQAETPV